MYNLHIGSYLYIAIDLNSYLFFKNIIAVIPLPEKEPKQDTSLLSNNNNVVVWQLPPKNYLRVALLFSFIFSPFLEIIILSSKLRTFLIKIII